MKVIDGLGFSLFSPEQIRRMSAIKITVPDTYDEDGYPISGGLADQRLGVIDPGLKCKTCGGRMRDCGGHFGHIELVRPVVHAAFAKAIYQLLKACCRKCGRLMHPAQSLSKIKKLSECPHCNEKQRPIKFIKPTTFYEDDRKLLPNEVRERLERIPDEDLQYLQVKVRPEWMVLTVLIVPPVTVRPSITLETGERSEDDLTHKLVDIIRINQRLEENVEAGAPQLIIEDLWELLQYHVSTYFDNEIAGIPPARHRSGRQLKTLFQRLKGKEGRFRYNLSGKRVNFSARTVISPDPTLGINELGVPEEIAAELTLPVAVTLWNVENLKEIIRQHPDKINYIIRPDGKRKKLTTSNMTEVMDELAPGYVVERQLMDDDVVIFNRQPSLHRCSMMCHSIKVLPGKTFRFNVADCRPYNADFDGDEMNIHVPQNEEAQSEAEVLMKVEDQTLSPRNGKPMISPDLDHVSGLFILTSPDTEFDRSEAAWLLSAAGVTDAEVSKNKIAGRDVFSSLLPQDLTVFLHAKRCKFRKEVDECDNPACVRIKNGKLLSGQVDSKISEDLVSLIAKRYGGQVVRQYIDGVTRMTVQLATRFGLSLSLDDYYMPPTARKEIIALYKDGRSKLRVLVHQFRSKKLKRLPGKTMKETLEEQVMEIVEGIRHDCWKIVRKNIKTEPVYIGSAKIDHNPATLMAQAGVKNKPINVVQMSALVGQQAVRGKRMTSGYRRRILPHFKSGDLSESARGFVRNSYKQGLSPTEYFFHAAGGRDSVVDKGVNPAKTGYMQRRLINALQDLIVQDDRSVHDSSNRIVQFLYGDDGKDPMDEKTVAPGEPVGVIAAQSIGEPGTQMSIAADEKVLVEQDGIIQTVIMGEFVDRTMQTHGFEKVNGADVLNVDENVGIRVPALTQEGKVEWKTVRQLSRHHCEKPILQITTRSGRKIRATDNHSFVLRENGKIVPVLGSALQVGQRIPVVKNLPVQTASMLEMESALPKDTHWYGSELKKALELPISRGQHNVGCTVPAAADALFHYSGQHQCADIEDGFFYPVQNHSRAHIPEKMPLDHEFGWLLGAHLSEGNLTRYAVGISNTDENFLIPVRRFAQRLGVGIHETDNFRGFSKGHDLTIRSSLLSEFFEKTSGKGSAHKKVPSFAFSAPDAFVSAALSAYFDGDGNVSVARKCIRVFSKSKELIDGISILLSRFGVFSTKHASAVEHRLSIPAKYAQVFREKIGFKSKEKQAQLDALCGLAKTRFNYDVIDMTTGFGDALSQAAQKLGIASRHVNKFTQKQEIGRQTLGKYVQMFEEKSAKNKIDVSKELALLKTLLTEDVAWDEIIQIEKVTPTAYVYDFAVGGLETFTTFDGIITHNTLRTFHYAGVASLAQLGFTRLVEIVDGRKTPKKPVMEIYLKKAYANDWEKAKAVAASIEEVTLDKVAQIEENFTRKVVTITLNRSLLQEKSIKESDVLAKIKEAAGEYEPDKDGNQIHFKAKDDLLKNIRKLTNKLRETHLKGIPGIKRAIIVEKEEGDKKILTLATEGSNLEAVFKMDEVDIERTTTNDIMEVASTLGIEAGRNAIVQEMNKVLEAQGLRVDARHVMLIADMMTASGFIQSVGRHGLAGHKSSVLARAAFEETGKHLVNACLTGEEDHLNGIIENIICGQIVPCGTGNVKLTMSADYLA